MTAHLRYLSYVIHHKWFVLYAGIRWTGAPLWRLLIHDWSKFLPSEWFPYVHSFYSRCHVCGKMLRDCYSRCDTLPNAPRVQKAFDRAWLHHQHVNAHHWQHWLLREDIGRNRMLMMPEHFVREMVADWMGAGRAITGRWEVREWYEKNAVNIALHPVTRCDVERLLESLP